MNLVELLKQLIDFLLHFDNHLREMLDWVGGWTYVFLFVIVFCETGLVVTPFLPGDSLLFAAGTLSATHALSLPVVLLTLAAAAILGDAVNYFFGATFGERFLATQKIPWIRKEHLDQTHAFFERYGNKTIVIARFAPFVRTFAPFVAGIGQMSYRQFAAYNVIGGCAWVLICTTAGFFFGNLPGVKDNFSLVVIGIVAVSLLPIAWESWQGYRRRKSITAKTAGAASTNAAGSESK